MVLFPDSFPSITWAGWHPEPWGHLGVQPGPGLPSPPWAKLARSRGGSEGNEGIAELEAAPGHGEGSAVAEEAARVRRRWDARKDPGEKQDIVRDVGGDSLQAGTDEKQQRWWQ